MLSLATSRTHHLTMKLFSANIATSLTSESNSALLPLNVDRRPPLQRGLMNFQLQNVQLYNKSPTDWSRGKELVLFPRISMFPEEEPRKTWRFSGNKINCFPRDQNIVKYGRKANLSTKSCSDISELEDN